MESLQECTECVMDTSAKEIVFDDKGVCNFCLESKKFLPNVQWTLEEGEKNLEKLAKKVKQKKRGKYDSILGLSGGVDSSYVAYLASKMGLNPLAVHFDNGWNSEIAVNNIKKITDKCGFDLSTYVINWPEFRDIQRAYFKAGVIDIEAITDHAITATMFRVRRQHGIEYVLSGTNIATEFGLPTSWVWNKHDLVNLRSIHKKHGDLSLKDFPTMTSIKKALSKKLGIGGTFAEPLNQIRFSKNDAMVTLREEFDWVYYGDKHFESVFTKFYQAYVLPVKFGVDKRKVHLSAQIRNGEISRAFAKSELEKPIYNADELSVDKDFVLKKLGFSTEEFDSLMKQPPVPHSDYPTDRTHGISALLIKAYYKFFKKK